MEPSLIYQAFRVGRNYQYHATAYKDNSIIFKLELYE